MPIQPNPFTPTFGRVPIHMAGRTQIIADVLTALRVGNTGDPNLTSLFVGPRGVGKTTLMAYLADEADASGWISARVTAMPGMLEDVIQRVEEGAGHLLDERRRYRVDGVSTPIGGLRWSSEPEIDEVPNWRTRMGILLDRLRETDTGVLITVDEVDPKLDELVQLVGTYQHFAQEERKVALLMAGLPYNVRSLLSGRSTSFLRRAFQHDLGGIGDGDIKEAFALTVESGGKTVSADALDRACEGIGGSPYMLQLVGYRSWNAAGDSSEIEEAHVERGVGIALEEMKDRIVESSVAELSQADRDFLAAMLVDADATDQRVLMERLGRSRGHVSTYKRRLLSAGMIEEMRGGRIRFALPGLREYLRETLSGASE